MNLLCQVLDRCLQVQVPVHTFVTSKLGLKPLILQGSVGPCSPSSRYSVPGGAGGADGQDPLLLLPLPILRPFSFSQRGVGEWRSWGLFPPGLFSLGRMGENRVPPGKKVQREFKVGKLSQCIREVRHRIGPLRRVLPPLWGHFPLLGGFLCLPSTQG